VAVLFTTVSLTALGVATPVAAQVVEIITGGMAPTATPSLGSVGPGVRVTAFVQIEPEGTQHRVVSPLLPEEILLVQESLAAAGADPGARDGVLGESTATALSRFQEGASLEPCGCVDYPTILALGLAPRVVQTVIGSPADESNAEVVVGNTQLPETPRPQVTPVPPPPDTLVVVHKVNGSWWGYPTPFAVFPPIGDGGRVGIGRPGFPFGPTLRLGAPRAVPPGR
jgi:peptidoglycan hydrolase-like protein with peptidoglycan-binding domain